MGESGHLKILANRVKVLGFEIRIFMRNMVIRISSSSGLPKKIGRMEYCTHQPSPIPSQHLVLLPRGQEVAAQSLVLEQVLLPIGDTT